MLLVGSPTSSVAGKQNHPPAITTLPRLWLLLSLLPACLASWVKYVEEYDPIRVARCDARCGENHPDECMENCLASNYTKPGYCPEKTSMSPFEAACLVACNGDFRCPELAKCCSHDCGVTCMHPIGLDNITDLPPIPENLQIRQQKSNLIHLTWKSNNGQLNNTYTDGDIRYLLEERHLLGPRYLESRLSPWTIRHVSTKPYAALRDRLRSGHWYQFRVAAVNSEGSRGYSLPSRPFKTKEPRSPKEPQNLTLFGARLVGGKLRINIRWTKPASDVPIAFYKVFWSRLIRGPTNDSILVYHRTVLKDKTCYELKNLELKCQYFLQVQAVALYGGRRLASRKASKVFNGTDYMAFADVGRPSQRCERRQDGLRVRRMICYCGEVRARVVWSANHKAKKYNVTLTEEFCPHEKNHSFHRKSMWKIIQATHYDLRYLRHGCTYSVNVRSIYNKGKTDEHGMNVEFHATGCSDQKRDEQQQFSYSKNSPCQVKSSRLKKRHTALCLRS